jgi:hypothetical protein
MVAPQSSKLKSAGIGLKMIFLFFFLKKSYLCVEMYVLHENKKNPPKATFMGCGTFQIWFEPSNLVLNLQIWF